MCTQTRAVSSDQIAQTNMGLERMLTYPCGHENRGEGSDRWRLGTCLPADVPSARTYPWHWLGVRLGRWGWLGAIHVGGLGLGLSLGLSGCSARGQLCVHREHCLTDVTVGPSTTAYTSATAAEPEARAAGVTWRAHCTVTLRCCSSSESYCRL